MPQRARCERYKDVHQPKGGNILKDAEFRRNNHYLSQGYLKRWAFSDGKLWAFRTLVSHPDVPFWKPVSPRGTAYHAHLYTRIAAGRETDDFERWLAQEFEAPAEEALRKATSDARMTPDDWTHLISFVAAQDVRTPARYLQNIKRWQTTLPQTMDKSLHESVQRLNELSRSGLPMPTVPEARTDGLPLRIVREVEPSKSTQRIGVKMLVGRGLWLWSMKHLLENTAKVLHEHRWTIIHPPAGVSWLTSDDPVLRLNFHSPSSYDFGGGWNSPGTEIIFPLSPEHLLYTQIGRRPPLRGEIMSLDRAKWVRRLVAEHAHRVVFASEPDPEVRELRPRIVDLDAFRRERTEWENWHEDQSIAERDLMHENTRK